MSRPGSSFDSANTLADALGLEGPDVLFPWQRDLLSRFLRGEIPRSLDIPTGLGKTAAMAIWLVARAECATLPRRLVYVVDRRAVVDQATAVAEDLRSFVDRTTNLKDLLGLHGRSLPISTLRGQHVDNREWLQDPVVPAIVVGTVDMIGSRLLFQGYGVTRKMRPYQAAMLATDVLVVLDEAHLVPPFEKLLERIAHGSQDFGPRDEERRNLVPPLRLMSLSATGRRPEQSFRLSPADFEHREAKRRLDAPKRVRLHLFQEEQKLANALADKAWGLSNSGTDPVRCIVFCDRRKDATNCKKAMDKRARSEGVEIDTELFVGARRVRERTVAAQRLESLGFLAGKRMKRTEPSFLLATSAGEVGVDLDSDCVVCDLVAWERMVQRLGRVNRRGDVPDGAEVVVFGHGSEPAARVAKALAKDPGERTEKEANAVAEHEVSLARSEALRLLPALGGGAVDASPRAILRLSEQAAAGGPTAETLARATTPEPLRPELSRALVEAWAMTSLEDHPGRPEVAPWLRGWMQEDPETWVVWRTYLPVRAVGPDASARDVDDFFEAAPPHLSEVLETETRTILDWLIARAEAVADISDDASNHLEDDLERPPLGRDDIVAITLTRAGKHRSRLRLRDLIPPPGKAGKRWKDELGAELVGLTVVIDARMGGLTAEGFLDSSIARSPYTVDGTDRWLEPSAAGEPPPVRFRVRIADAGQSVSAAAHWHERLRFAAAMSEEAEPIRWLIVERWREVAKKDGRPSMGAPALLKDHLSLVEEHARALAKAFELPGEYEAMLGAAASVHDEGKAAPRWQRAARAPGGREVYAKPFGSMNQALLEGYRHELGTLVRVQRDDMLAALGEEVRDLALHLIAAHHGFARPVISTNGCDDAPPSVLQGHAEDIFLRYARLQERWGPWALAWFESLLRAADQQASRDSDADPEVGSG